MTQLFVGLLSILISNNQIALAQPAANRAPVAQPAANRAPVAQPAANRAPVAQPTAARGVVANSVSHALQDSTADAMLARFESASGFLYGTSLELQRRAFIACGGNTSKIEQVSTAIGNANQFSGDPKKQMRNILRGYLTEDEAQEILRFVATPAGRKYVTMPAALNNSFSQVISGNIAKFKIDPSDYCKPTLKK